MWNVLYGRVGMDERLRRTMVVVGERVIDGYEMQMYRVEGLE